ncbi:hypothetical protein NC653_032052 [Populus alba x Populus x berolinensis]|uniref:Uncharacterized protein n=1 Tax=Populus alba x Populus x berolinensis TaxID=444605 RepID=A0AAD6PXK4_9ROSI|nr:hypothetical protein NC653_032052 [Populus alba x Populus x berolinensis]
MKCAPIWQVVQIVICVRGSADCPAIPSSLWVVARYVLHVCLVGPLLLHLQLCWVSLCGFILLVRPTIETSSLLLLVVAGWVLKNISLLGCF